MNLTPRAERLPSVTPSPRERREAVATSTVDAVETSVSRRAERDGCGCPAFAVRCAHFEGQTVRLVDVNPLVYSVHGPFPGCPATPCAACPRVCSYIRNDLPAAEAEFEKRAAELRQGVEA